MPEKFTQAERSRIMAAVKSRDTKPEIVVRCLIHRLGYRFRLHRRNLPGTPDIVLPRLRRIINVHGCFWHLHDCRHGRIAPATNAAYWANKRLGNAARDQDVVAQLRRRGWRVLTVWECQTRNVHRLTSRLAQFLRAESSRDEKTKRRTQ